GREGNDAVVIEEDQRRSYMGMPSNFRVRSIITNSHRLTVYSCAEWGELYDLAADPNEFDNLWDDPGSAALKADLLEQLARKLMDLADPSPLCTGHGP
ncbi:MAG: sulfatase/phosphatase domain-containing protein, partial [Alphaproteobacteria bacterium]